MKGMRVQDNFLQQGKGGTELAPMSTTSDLSVALEYSASKSALLLRLNTASFMERGADISFLSAFPAERGRAEVELGPTTAWDATVDLFGVPHMVPGADTCSAALTAPGSRRCATTTSSA